MSTFGNNIRGILLDLDNTLYAYEPCNTAGLGAAFAYLSKKLKKNKKEIAKTFVAARNAVKKQIPETGASHSRLLYFQKCTELLIGRTDMKLALATGKIFWNAYFSKMKLRPGAKRFPADIKKHGLKIAVISDFTTEIQMRKLIRLGIASFIDTLITSEESGRDKPAPNSFRLALTKLDLRANEVVMIGDDDVRDRIGANRLKIKFLTADDITLKIFVKIVAPHSGL